MFIMKIVGTSSSSHFFNKMVKQDQINPANKNASTPIWLCGDGLELLLIREYSPKIITKVPIT
ncbi:hypothetical protein CGJ42_06945 [Vibrio parahaemolyticus]|nr:hypothetical protein CGJ42_06945 [Vibrio parahaemolyticus]